MLCNDPACICHALLLQHVKSQHGIQAAPVVAFGGSYGGVLAGYLRMKFPNVVYAAVASSAPFRCNLIGQGWDPTSYWEVRLLLC